MHDISMKKNIRGILAHSNNIVYFFIFLKPDRELDSFIMLKNFQDAKQGEKQSTQAFDIHPSYLEAHFAPLHQRSALNEFENPP